MIEYYTDYENWLEKIGHSVAFNRNERIRLRRLKNIYDIETEFANDKCASILDDLSYYERINNNNRESHLLKNTLKNYIKFLESTKLNTKKRVGKFTGNYEGFYSYVNTKRNRIIQDLTSQDYINKNKGKCSYCENTVEHLETVHINKLSRTDIIKSILDRKYKTSNDLYEVDLVEFEKDIRNERFIYLCPYCYQRYHDDRITEAMMNSRISKTK